MDPTNCWSANKQIRRAIKSQCDANSSQLLQLDILGGDILGGDASTRAQPAELHPDSTIAAACARASPDTAAPCSSVTTQQHEDNMLLSFDMLGGVASASRAPQPVQLVALHPETPIAADYTRLSPDAANASNCVTTLQVAGSMLPHLDMLGGDPPAGHVTLPAQPTVQPRTHRCDRGHTPPSLHLVSHH